MVGTQARLQQVKYAIKRGVSQRRACALIGVSRSGVYYQRKQPVKDAPVIESMQRLSAQYPRFGSRRIRIFLARDNLMLGKERCARIWALAGLQVPAKRRRKRICLYKIPRVPAPEAQNGVWYYDFIMEWFRNRLEARVVINDWNDHYNSIRPHSSLNYQTPHEFIEKLGKISNTEVRYLN